MEDLVKIEVSLERLHADFNKQLEALGGNSKEFHNAIIELSSKYPDHKELLQFIVFINDKLETNQLMFTEIVVESFNEMISVKKTLVHKMITEKGAKKKSVLSKVKQTVTLKDAKMVLILISISLISFGVIVAPDTFIAVLKAMGNLVTGAK